MHSSTLLHLIEKSLQILSSGVLSSAGTDKGKSQLDPVKIEKTLNLANVRIHVERVIGVLRQKYSILQSTDYLMCDTSKDGNEDVPLVNRMIRVCVALVNLCPPIIPFD